MSFPRPSSGLGYGLGHREVMDGGLKRILCVQGVLGTGRCDVHKRPKGPSLSRGSSIRGLLISF